MGRPILAFDKNGEKVWSCDYDIYGGLRNLKGDKSFIPFRQLGQYEDIETGLYYNRFRYYDCNIGTYISKDPISILGGLNVYAYVKDVNTWVDVLGLRANLPSNIDFSNSLDLFPHEKAIIVIKMQGSRGRDFTEAFRKSGIDRKLATEYTWHHMHDFNPDTGEVTMQLVKTKAHQKTFPHKGGVDQFLKYFELEEYTSKGGAVDIAKKKGWITCKK